MIYSPNAELPEEEEDRNQKEKDRKQEEEDRNQKEQSNKVGEAEELAFAEFADEVEEQKRKRSH